MLESCKAGAEKQQNVEKRLNVLTISVFPNIITIKELGTGSGTGSGTKNNKNDNYMGKVMKNLTISQIAELAGVSKTTVSRVLNNKDDIKGETRERILQVIRENNYRPNSAARTINNRSTRTIGLLIPYQADYVLSNPFYYDVIRGITVEADLNDYYTLLMYSQKDSYLKTVREKRIDGLLLISFGTQHIKLLQELLETDIPMISLAKVPGFSTVPTVSVDDFDGAKKAVSHLIEQGHRDIAVINGPQTLVGHAERIKGYRAVLESHGIPYREELVLEREISVENGHLAMRRLRAHGGEPRQRPPGSGGYLHRRLRQHPHERPPQPRADHGGPVRLQEGPEGHAGADRADGGDAHAPQSGNQTGAGHPRLHRAAPA